MNILELPFDPHSPASCLDRQHLLARECPRPTREELRGNLDGAQPIHEWLASAWLIVWSDPMMKMADGAAGELHQWLTVTQDLLPRKTVLWLYSTPKISDEDSPIVMELGVLFHLERNELHLVFPSYALVPDSNLSCLATSVSLGDIPDDDEVQHLLKVMRFAQSPYLAVQPGHVPRHAARRAARYSGNAEVGFITLRRSLRMDGREAGDAELVDWQCQWPVSGHWRRQWYPSDQVHRPVWIAPYIKGPPDKPFKGNPGKMMR